MKTQKPESNTKDSDEKISRAKRERYRLLDFGDGYDSRYEGGINSVNTEVEHRWICRNIPEGPVLDAGAGTGRFSSVLAAMGHPVTALDSSASMLATLKDRAPEVTTVEGDIYSLPFGDNRFSAALCMHVLFHLPDWQRVVAELARVLAPGGRLFFEMRNGEHVKTFGVVARALGLLHGKTTIDNPSSATYSANGAQVRKALDNCGVSMVKNLRYDIGHSYWYRPLNRVTERLLAGSNPAQRAFTHMELTLGRACPGWLAYRTLYMGCKR
jgi:2-polyprenyl-3-methyl-5-hydroxy-6-metoxy-1,4-benzoquinol methylase